MDIRLEEISKTFGETLVVRELSAHLSAGNIIGLLGPNGAGKTTTIRMMLNLIAADSGKIIFDEQPFHKKMRAKIGYLPEERGIYQPYKVVDVLTYLGRLNGLSKRSCEVEIVRLLDRFQMIETLEKQVQQLSKGQQQILQYIAANLHSPEFIVLDEPFNGLDPINEEIFEKHLRELKARGCTILLSTHRLSEAENLCDQFLLLNRGRLLLQGTLAQIQKKYSEDILFIESNDNLSLLNEIEGLSVLEINGTTAKAVFDGQRKLRRILEEVVNTLDIRKIELNKPGLRDIFLSEIKMAGEENE